MSGASTFGEALLRLAPTDIFIPKRLGLYFPDKAAALGQLIAVDGQGQPIIVRRPITKEEKASGKPFVLIAGRHRLAGVEMAGLPFVIAVERLNVTLEQALGLEASENLDRRDQPPLERAIFIFATCEAAQKRLALQHGDLSPQQIGIKGRWAKVKAGELRTEQVLQEECDDSADTMSALYGWEESVAEAFGRDKRTIRRALALYRLVIEPFPELTQALSDHPVVGNNAAQLKAIADLPGENQRRAVIEALLADPELSADEARVQVGIAGSKTNAAAGPPHQKFYNQISSGWERLSTAQRRQFIPTIAAMVGAPEMKRELRDQLNRDLGLRDAAGAAPQADREGPTLKPVVPIRQSVKPDYIVCLEDGTRHINLTRRLIQLGMTPDEYRARWSLPRDYPMLAPNYHWKRTEAWHRRVTAARAAARKAAVDA